MSLTHLLYFLFYLSVILCGPLSVDKLPKCSIKDNECQRNLYKSLVENIGAEGFSEIGIPSTDPMILKNISVSVLNLVNITMIDGVAEGVKKCIFHKFEVNIDTGIGTLEVTCDITIKGQYLLTGDSPIVKNLVGDGGVHGEGIGKVMLDQIYMTWKFSFYPEKHDDGEIYFKSLYNDIDYTYDIKGKATFAADSVYVGKENISELVVNYMNENWKYLLKTFGKVFVDKAMEIFFSTAQKFFEGVPARHYILEDMTPYLKKKM